MSTIKPFILQRATNPGRTDYHDEPTSDEPLPAVVELTKTGLLITRTAALGAHITRVTKTGGETTDVE